MELCGGECVWTVLNCVVLVDECLTAEEDLQIELCARVAKDAPLLCVKGKRWCCFCTSHFLPVDGNI